MAGTAIPVPPGAGVVSQSSQSTPQPSTATAPSSSKAMPVPSGAGVVHMADVSLGEPTEYNDSARKLGYYRNDVGNKVIVPRDGENFSDTLKRATEHGRLLVDHQGNLTAQGNEEFNREESEMPGKSAEALGGAALAGVAGPAGLAAPGEIMQAIPSVLPHTITGVRAIGTWAAKNPVSAYLLYKVLTEFVPGMKKAIGIVKEAPTGD